PGPALGSFIEQDLAAIVRRRQGFATDLVIFKLIDGLDRLLQSRLERSEDDLIESFGRLEDQTVPPIFDEGNDTVRLGAHGIAGVFLRGNLVGGLPEPLLAIEHETIAVLVTASPPPEVDPPDGGCVSVDQLEEGLTVLGDLTRAALEYAAHVLEPQPAADFVTEAGPFLFIAGDPIAPLGRHVLKPQEVIQALEIRLLAVLTEVISGLTWGKLLDIAARAALLGGLGDRSVAVGDRQDDLVDDVGGALVIDDAARAELGDRQEARAREEFVAALDAFPRGDERGERQAGEVVARQKALAGKVAVGVEIRLHDVARVGQQGNLGFRFPAQPFGLFPLGLSGDVGNHLVLIIPLSLGRPEQAAPTLASGFEILHRLVQDLLQPARLVPRSTLELPAQRVENGLGLVAGGDQSCL